MKFEIIHIDDYEVHELAGVYAEHINATMVLLERSIKQWGILVPVIIHNDRIIDGRVRHLIAKELGITSLPAIFIDEPTGSFFQPSDEELTECLSTVLMKDINITRALPEAVLKRL